MGKRKSKKEYSKSRIDIILFFCMFWLSVFYISDIYFNHGEHLETLSITLVTSIVSIMIPYFIKSYFGKKQEVIMGNENISTDEMEGSNGKVC